MAQRPIGGAARAASCAARGAPQCASALAATAPAPSSSSNEQRQQHSSGPGLTRARAAPPAEQIFSIDVDASGDRLVTSGATAVRVWSLAPVLDEKAELDEAGAPRLLATLQDHNAPVNVARFSRDGARIASGSGALC